MLIQTLVFATKYIEIIKPQGEEKKKKIESLTLALTPLLSLHGW